MEGASKAVVSKIMSHEGAAAAMATTMEQAAAGGKDRQSEFRPGAGLPAERPG